ncbi:Myblike DNAbinding domain-containing protein [Linnemannia exigua]|uniref:Myblike DNAbinding domain-containing protein n=1 Tax=Linnemannia exigua TaxID=604196 RepID=A0AAD4H1W0_9FUNG|nr:Myblike DNAbinding domain-containing protein [Linnemannia exigua]
MRRHVLSAGHLLHRHPRSTWICRSFQTCSPTEFIASCLATMTHAVPAPTRRFPRPNLITRSFLAPSLGILRRESTATSATRYPLTRGRHQVAQTELFQQARFSTLSPSISASVIQDEPSSSQTRPSSVKPRLASRNPRSQHAGTPWTAQEDEILFDLRQQRVKWRTIGAELNRTIASCYSRYYRFLDPFLADAIESEPEEEEEKGEAESSKEDIKARILNGTLEKPSVRPQPYVERGPWTAKEREKLEIMVKAKIPWTIISRELQRNQDSCKEKSLRIQKSRLEKQQYSKKVRGKQWTRLYKEGFTAHHRDQLVRAVEKHLTAKRSSAIYGNNPLMMLGVKDPQEEEEEEEEEEGSSFDFTATHQTPIIPGQPSAIDDNSSAEDLDVETIDWDAISQALKNKFPASRLRSIYHELSAAKLVWTPEEDERLFRAVIRLGPPEFQPKIWTMIKDAFGDVIRTGDDYRARWRELDMPQLEREWDRSEKTRFWRRWMEYQSAESLLRQLPPPSDISNSIQPVLEPRPLLMKPSHEISKSSRMEAWDLIAEGLEYRHGRDCQIYFDHTTRNFPKDPELFRYLTFELAKAYVEPRAVPWSSEAARLLVATVNSFLQVNKAVKWESVAQALDHQYTAEQCEAKWLYWSQNHVPLPNAATVDDSNRKVEREKGLGLVQLPTAESAIESEGDGAVKMAAKRRLWTDSEVELLKKGVKEYGLQWSKIRDAYLPHRTIQMVHERYWRMQAKKRGRFSEKERGLLETAIEIFGEDADWELIAGQVPGRSASQCRKNWVVWSGQERDRLMELVMDQLSRKDKEEEEARLRAASETGSTNNDQEGQQQSQYEGFVDLTPRYKGKKKIDWNEIAKEFKGRTSQQCRLQFDVHRALYRLQGDF